jgi:multidrug efflux pump subunit AcrA (membrane-fusion protein)
MKHRKIWIGSGLVLLIAAMITVYVIRNTQAQAEVKTVKPTREEISEEIVTSGVLEAGEQQEVYLDPERGQLAEIPVKPGKKVKKGTTLVRYRKRPSGFRKAAGGNADRGGQGKAFGPPAAAERSEKGRSIHARCSRRIDV